jgi:hypothetical protein
VDSGQQRGKGGKKHHRQHKKRPITAKTAEKDCANYQKLYNNADPLPT